MGTIKGYGVSIRNTPIDITKTVSYQELNSIGIYGTDAVIDIVRSDTANRPGLVHLIETLEPDDRIDMYSIDAFLMGDNRKAKEYYAAIIEKGIDLLIYDFSGAVAKMSPFSTLKFGRIKEDSFVRKEKTKAELIEAFSLYADNATPQKNSGGLKTEERRNISDAFKEIYFAYESYQIDQSTTLSLLREYCGIENKITFWLMARDFETSLWYSEELAMQSSEILDLPKRCGGLPEEYNQIVSYADTHFSDIPSEKERVELAMEALNMIGSYGIFYRWKLLAEKKPKPRKPAPYNFSIKEFKNKYTPLSF